MAGHHFQGRGHSHGHQHFHSRALHLELEQPNQLDTRAAIVNAASEGVDVVVSQVMARENNLDEKPVGGSNALTIALSVW